MVNKDFRDKTAVVGVGNTDFRAMYGDLDPERSPYTLGAHAFKAALADAGLTKDDVDGVLVCRIPDYGRMCDVLGIRYPRFTNVFQGAGRMAGLTLQSAAMAVYTGMADVVACIYGNNGRSVGARYGGGAGGDSETAMYDVVYGMTSPGASVAHMYQRYRWMYEPPEEALAHLAINNRENALLNPVAVMQRPLTMEDYINSRYIAEPLRLFDYCLINDGAVCLIVTSAERARDLRRPPVYISAMAAGGDFHYQYTVDDFFYTPLSRMADELFPAADMTQSDIDVAGFYDNFTPTILFTLEGMGFCGKGEAGHWVTPERISRAGDLPINTSGGHTSESYMQGWALLAEAVRQVRGECGPRQVADCRTALYTCAAQITNAVIFRR